MTVRFKMGFERPELKNFEAYSPGRTINQVKKQFHLKRVVKLASNENSWGPSPRAVRAAQSASRFIHRYPEGASPDLRMVLAHKHKVHPDQVIVGAGSDEIIELLGKAFLRSYDDIVVSAHAFIRYRMAGELMGCHVRTVPMRYFRHDLAAMAAAVTKSTKLVFIANPNNPTGTYNTAKEVRQFLKSLLGETLSIWDEAYFDYAHLARDYGSILENRLANSRTVVLRTFSKAHALAGLRVGYAVAPSWVVRALDRIRPPFNVTHIGQAAALASLEDGRHIDRSVRMNADQREFLCGELERLGVNFVPSCANFLLINVAPRRGRDVFEELLCRGVIVRAVDEYGLPGWVRVTVGTPQENRIFMRAFEAVLGDSRRRVIS